MKDESDQTGNELQRFEKKIKILDTLNNCFPEFPEDLKKNIKKVYNNVVEKRKKEVLGLEECIVDLIDVLNGRFTRKVQDIKTKHTDYKKIAQKLSSQLKNALNLTILSIWVTAKKFLDDDKNLNDSKSKTY